MGRKPFILARFDYREPGGFELHRQPMLQVPEVGQDINIEGYPFIVTDVGWALPTYEEDDEYLQYAYITVVKAKKYKLQIRGKVL